MPVCARCQEDNPERGRFCLACGAPLTAATPPGEGRRNVTVVFVDVVGSTSLAERLDAESLGSVMRRYFDLARDAFERHGGTVQKFIGDAVMAVFGVPALHEDDALRAVRAAAEVHRALDGLNEDFAASLGVRLQVRTGINTGEVVAGRPEPGHALVLGDAVNVASRLEREAEPGQILLGPETYGLVRNTVLAEPVEALALRGKAEAVEAYRLVEVGTDEARRLLPEAPMVGRDRELQVLLDAFEDVTAKGRTHLVSVIGAPGLGKSRLVKEFLWAVEGRATVLSGRCLPYGEGITFWPLLEAVREAAGILDDDAPETARDKVAASVSEAGDAERIGEKLTGLLGFGQRVATLEEGFWAARRFLETLAWRRPVVAVFDDVHWAEPGFLDLVAYLHRLGEDAPLLIVAQARPDLLETRPDWGGEVVPLAPLSAEESAELLSSLVGGGELPETATRRIAQAAEGNPLFVGEMFLKLIDDDLLRHDAGRWVAAGNLDAVTVPPTVNALLAARLDRLSPEERGVIERASVLGKEFDERTLWALTPPADRAGVGARLDALSRRDLVQAETGPMAEPGTYRFTHILIRDAAYQGMLKQARADLHERYATWLATRAGDRPQEEIVGYHLEQAHHYRAALGGAEEEVRDLAGMAAAALSAAGHRAWARGDIPATVNLLERAAALEPDEPRRLALLPDLGDALAEGGEFARAAALLEEAVERSRALGDAAGEWHARISQVKTLVLTDPHGMADQERRVADEAIEVFTRTGDELGLARAWHLRARADNLWGRMEDRKNALTQALGHARIAGAVRDQTQILTEIVSAVFYGPTPAEEGIAWCDRILEESSGNPRIEARVMNAEAGFLAMQGRFEEARDRVRRSAALFEELGMTVMGAVTAQDRSIVFMLAGDPKGAEEELRRGYEVLERIGEASYQCSLACMIGQSLVVQGRMDEAEAYARTGAELAAHDDYDAQIMWRSVLARVHAARGEHAEAETLAREAVRLAFETDFFQSRADSLSDLAEVLDAAGRPDDARTEAGRAIEILQSKGNVVTAGALRERWGSSMGAAQT